MIGQMAGEWGKLGRGRREGGELSEIMLSWLLGYPSNMHLFILVRDTGRLKYFFSIRVQMLLHVNHLSQHLALRQMSIKFNHNTI